MRKPLSIATDVADKYALAKWAANGAEPYDHQVYERARYALIDTLREMFAEWPEPVAEALVQDALDFTDETGEPVSHYVNWHLPVKRVVQVKEVAS